MTLPPKSVSRHVSLAGELLAEIGPETYPVGARYPTEQDLQDRFGVGRHTVREALKLLTEQGILGRRRKTGTVVLAHRPISPYVHTLRDFGGLMDFAETTRLEVSHVGHVTAPRDLRDDPAGGEAKRWMRVAGLRLKRPSDEPLCWAEILVPDAVAPSREAVARGGRPIYEMVMAEHAVQLGHVEQDISAASLPPAMAKALGAEPHGPALVVKRRYVSEKGATFEFSHTTFPSDRYSVRSIIRKRA